MLFCFLTHIFIRNFLNLFTFENILHLNSADWSCKHAIALLFGLADHVVNIEHRTTIRVTDAAADRNKPRKVNIPVVAHDLDIILHSYLS